MRTDHPCRGRQQGLAIGVLVIALFAIVALVLIGKSLTRDKLSLDGSSKTEVGLERISSALVSYASLNRRLPCPASGIAATGVEEFAGTTANCTQPNGVVPWATLGLSREDSLDGWGRKVSYRVYSGVSGLTQPEGINLTNCNSNPGAVASSTLGANGACEPDHRNSYGAFVGARAPMLTVNELGTIKTNLAFVLISHGISGKGAYGAEADSLSGRNDLPPSAGVESQNVGSTAPFRIESRSAIGVSAEQVAHFDDLVLFKPLFDLVMKAGVAARDWGIEPASLTTSSTSFNAAAVTAAGGSASTNTGSDTLTFGTGAGAVTVYSFGGSSRDISTGGTSDEGIGAIQSGSSALAQAPLSSDGDGDGLLLLFASSARNFGATLIDFGKVSGDAERVDFYFYQTLTGFLSSPVTKVACKAEPTKANFVVTPPSGFGEFDAIFILPLSRASLLAPSEFFLGSTRTCTVAGDICTPPNAALADNCYAVTPSAGANGTISAGTAQSVAHDATVTFSVTPAMGYVATVGGTCGGSLVGTTFSTNKVTSDCTVEATFTPTP